eukprot:17441_3
MMAARRKAQEESQDDGYYFITFRTLILSHQARKLIQSHQASRNYTSPHLMKELKKKKMSPRAMTITFGAITPHRIKLDKLISHQS